jgi:hypothetical protein
MKKAILFLTITSCALAGSADVELAEYVLPSEKTGFQFSIPIKVSVSLSATATNPIPEKADPIGILTTFPYEDDCAVDTVMEAYQADPDSWHGQALRIAAAGFGICGDYPMFRETALRLYQEDTNKLDSAILAIKSLVIVPETRPEARSLLLSNLERCPGEPQLLKLLSHCDLAEKEPSKCRETTALLLDAVENDFSVLETVVTHVLLASSFEDEAEFSETAKRLAQELKKSSESELNPTIRTLLFLYGSILRHSAETAKDDSPDLSEIAETFLSRGINPFERTGK